MDFIACSVRSRLSGAELGHSVGWAAPTSQDVQRLATYIYQQVIPD
ncbi:hypothetical protein [Oscillatoria sp. FACHB-1406]|nr:hypothetical protein [Oscillatoria sp. FACHB-1406]MBD2579086.1 hypothetical protein [Oscillatoria sp. FACHB-1406]